MTTSSEEYSSGAGAAGDESNECEYDSEYPGTSVQRMLNVRRRVAQLNATAGVVSRCRCCCIGYGLWMGIQFFKCLFIFWN